MLRRPLLHRSDVTELTCIIGHYQYLNRHNQPEARLIRGHMVIEKPRTCKALYFVSNIAATILCMPITIDRIRNTSVDGIVNGVDVRTFIDDFSGQAKSQITLVSAVSVSQICFTTYRFWQAGVSVAMDVAILAIPGLGMTVTSRTLCSCSLLFGVGCIFAATMVQHFGERMRSIDFAVRFAPYYCSLSLTLLIEQVYYLQKKMMMLIVITSIPTCFCVLRSVSFDYDCLCHSWNFY